MTTALMCLKQPRPETIRVHAAGGGCLVSVSILQHDRWYLAKIRWFRRQIFAKHPDHSGHSYWFLKTLKQYKAFQKRELAYYAGFNLKPPKNSEKR